MLGCFPHLRVRFLSAFEYFLNPLPHFGILGDVGELSHTKVRRQLCGSTVEKASFIRGMFHALDESAYQKRTEDGGAVDPAYILNIRPRYGSSKYDDGQSFQTCLAERSFKLFPPHLFYHLVCVGRSGECEHVPFAHEAYSHPFQGPSERGGGVRPPFLCQGRWT